MQHTPIKEGELLTSRDCPPVGLREMIEYLYSAI